MVDQPTPRQAARPMPLAGARRRRGEPLRAATPPSTGADPAVPTPRQRVGLVAGVGIGVAVAMAGLVYAVIAIPLYVAAQTDADGLDRPFIRTAFFAVALPAGAVAGVVAGALVGAWLAKGGRLPSDRSSMYDRTPGT